MLMGDLEVIEISASASSCYHFVRVVARMTHISYVEGFLPLCVISTRKETFSRLNLYFAFTTTIV